MREAGFEPAHPGIRELKSRGIDQLTDSRVHRNVTVTNFLDTNDHIHTPHPDLPPHFINNISF